MKRQLAGTAVAVILTVAAAGCGGSSAVRKQAAPNVRDVRRALVDRLQAKHLSFRWVACLRNGRTFQNMPIVRCNVNFGDPHIEAYCSVLEHGRLVTNHDNPSLPCRHDDAGWTAPIVTS